MTARTGSAHWSPSGAAGSMPAALEGPRPQADRKTLWSSRVVAPQITTTRAPDRPFRKSCHDHGSTGAGGWRDKSENLGPAEQVPRLVIEWTAGLQQQT